jgi:hypothetical protein
MPIMRHWAVSDCLYGTSHSQAISAVSGEEKGPDRNTANLIASCLDVCSFNYAMQSGRNPELSPMISVGGLLDGVACYSSLCTSCLPL